MNLEKLIDEYLDVCELQNKLDNKTTKAYKIDLKQYLIFVGDRQDFYEKDLLCKYIEVLNIKNYSIKTVKRKIATVKAFFSYLTYEDILEYNPFSKIRLRLKEPIILPKIIYIDELKKLFKYIYDKRNKIDTNTYKYKAISRDIVILELLIGTGIRISELCNLRIEDISYSEKLIKIYGKGSKERIIPIFDKNVWKELNKYKMLFNYEIKKEGYFFINRLNKKISDQSIRNSIKNYCYEAKITKHITPHMFRHTFATLLLENDVDSLQIQQLLGHTNITTTQIYTHVTSNKKNEIMKYKNPRLKITI